MHEQPASSTASCLVIGCGNLLRGDDAAGPLVARRLAEQSPADIDVVDAGTAGLSVVPLMRGRDRVIVIDAARSGSPPGTIHRLSGREVETDPPAGLNPHGLRWDHALALGRQLLADDYPDEVSVYLIEAASLALGADVTPAVSEAVAAVAARILEAERARSPDGAPR
ncbi:MAG: hydrogenase maturation protease [Gaiellales bacterium]